MDAIPEVVPLSWRDPAGFVVKSEGRILRAVVPEKSDEVRALIRTRWMAQLIEAGDIPGTIEMPEPPELMGPANGWLWLRHDALPFPCYPHEISALQLYDAALLTLNVAIKGAEQGWILKDASAWNILYSRGRPVFVDLLSFQRERSDGTWVAYGQFARHFLLPLLLYRKLGITPPEIFLTSRDGVTPEHAYRLLRGVRLMSLAAIELVTLPKMLARSGDRLIAAHSTDRPRTFDAEVGKRVLLSTLHRLQRMLVRLRPDRSKSTSVWKDYEEDRHHYTEADLAAKKEFVRRHIGEGKSILDLGCNAGEFSLLAAECDKTVVAADADQPALSRLYARIRGRSMPITPVVLQIGRPTPAVGWQNAEVGSFLDRSAGQFDCILVLGLIHHLLVGERITLPMLADLLDRFNPKRVILEWVDPGDPKFRQLAGLNGALYRQFDSASLEACIGRKFRMAARLPLPCATRVMYLWCRPD